jgi:hypothetical protein
MEKTERTDKPQWQQPLLVVISRNKPEENVLHSCKLVPQGIGGGSHNQVSQCLWILPEGGCDPITRCENFEAS